MTRPWSPADEAIETVARWVLGNLMEEVSLKWDEYPEIGECDWDDVCSRVYELANEGAPSIPEFRAAYAVLEGRADHD